MHVFPGLYLQTFITIKLQEKQLSMTKVFKRFVSDQLKVTFSNFGC